MARISRARANNTDVTPGDGALGHRAEGEPDREELRCHGESN